MTADISDATLARDVAPERTDTYTQARIERIVWIAVGVGAAILGAQAFLNALAVPQLQPGWQVPVLSAVFAPLILMIVSCFVGYRVRLFAGVFAIIFPLCLLMWPFVSDADYVPVDPWLWYLVNIATVAAVVAFPLGIQVIWAGFVPLLYGTVRLAQLAEESSALRVVGLNVVFAVILAAVVVILGWMLRTAAVGIDRARADAVASHALAAAVEAAETERVAVAALMHDSVLAALIAAERADSDRERTLAVAMAREALTRLANAERDAGEGSDEPISAWALAEEIAVAAEDYGIDLTVARDIRSDDRMIPGRVARALVLAAAQAVANSVQHAGGAGLSAEVIADRRSVAVRVVDTGAGFSFADVYEDRLGIRGSIIARIAAVAGHADISTSERGTVVSLEWEHAR